MAGNSLVVAGKTAITAAAKTGEDLIVPVFKTATRTLGDNAIVDAEIVAERTIANNVVRATGVTTMVREGGGFAKGLKNLVKNNPKTFMLAAAGTGLAVEVLQWKEAASLLSNILGKYGAKKALSVLTDDDKLGDATSYKLSCMIAKILALPKDLSMFLLRSLDEDKFLYFSNADLSQFGVPVSTKGFDIFKALDTIKLALSDHFDQYVTHGKFLLDNDLMTVVAAGSNDKNYVVKMALSREAIPLIVEQVLSDAYPDKSVASDIKDNLIMSIAKLLEDYRLTGNVKKQMVALELSQYL